MTKKIDIKLIIIFIMGFIILGLNLFSNNDGDKKIIKVAGKKYQVVKTIIDTQYVKTTKILYKNGKTIYREKPIYIDIPNDIDTTEIIKDYYSKVFYDDTFILDDNLGVIVVKDTICKNSIYSRKWIANVNKISIKQTDIVEELPKNQLLVGGVSGILSIENGYIGPSIMLKTKKDTYINVSVGAGFNKLMVYQVGIHKPIKFKLWP